jgi:DNA-directed RNA polymerase specialized sigma24 family protein
VHPAAADDTATGVVRRGAQAQRLEDPFAQCAPERLTRDPLHDLGEQQVVRVRVGRDAARRELERQFGRGGDEPDRRDHDARVAGDRAAPRLEPHVVGDAARVVEQVAQANSSALAEPPGQPLLDRVVQLETAPGDELHHHRGDEALRHAQAATVLRAVAQLPDGDRVALALRYFAQLPDGEAAKLAGASTGAYRVRLVRARRRLESLLEDLDD